MSFIRGTEYANKLNSWHNNLEEDRQQRASLRRCSSLLDVYTSSGFRDLLFKLKPLWEGKAAWRYRPVRRTDSSEPCIRTREEWRQDSGNLAICHRPGRRPRPVPRDDGKIRDSYAGIWYGNHS